ncbi:MAG: FkbM family methyltransferase, partial [Acidobacteriota bacterium]
NGLRDTVDLSCLGVGVSDERSGGFAMERRDRNLGAARMIAGQGDLEVFRADALFAEETPDFIKIDIEGFEYPALVGAKGAIETSQPVILFEAGPHLQSAKTPSTSERARRSR